MDKILTITEAKAQLSALIQHVIKSGEAILIGPARNPVVKIVPYRSKQKNSIIGMLNGKATLPADWKEWPEDMLEKLGYE
jgi:antitoxin (DNA-binding transcriptional repressor) of toxin-antitoxin stability system